MAKQECKTESKKIKFKLIQGGNSDTDADRQYSTYGVTHSAGNVVNLGYSEKLVGYLEMLRNAEAIGEPWLIEMAKSRVWEVRKTGSHM